MDLKDNIKRFRELKGLSVPALARELGVGKQSVYDWEAGKYEPGPDNIDHLARVLDVKKKDLFDENPTSDQKAGDNTEKMDKEVSQDLRDLIERNDKYRLIPTLILTEYEILSKREQNERERLLQQMLTQAQEISATKQVIIDSQEKLIADYEKEIDDYVKIIEDLRNNISELQKLPVDVPIPAKQT